MDSEEKILDLAPGEILEIPVRNPNVIDVREALDEGFCVKHTHKLVVEGKGTLLVVTMWREDE